MLSSFINISNHSFIKILVNLGLLIIKFKNYNNNNYNKNNNNNNMVKQNMNKTGFVDVDNMVAQNTQR